MTGVDFSYLPGFRREQPGLVGSSRAAKQFLKLVDDEIYNSDISFLDGVSALDLAFQKKGGLIPIAEYSGRTELSALRSWRHIRKQSADRFSIYYPAEGYLTVTQYGRTVDIYPGEFAVTFSNEPFRIRNHRGSARHCRSYHVFVPSYLFYGSFPEIKRYCARAFRADVGQSRVAHDLFMSLFHEAGRLPAEFEINCATMAVRANAEAIRTAVSGSLPRVSPVQRRIDGVLRYIEQNLEDPDLCAKRVARDCGISIRYLHYLMKRDGKTYQDHVRNVRMERAMRLLTDCEFDGVSITDIAYRLGFKSGNHFSQAFRKRFDRTPSQARLERAAAA